MPPDCRLEAGSTLRRAARVVLNPQKKSLSKASVLLGWIETVPLPFSLENRPEKVSLNHAGLLHDSASHKAEIVQV